MGFFSPRDQKLHLEEAGYCYLLAQLAHLRLPVL